MNKVAEARKEMRENLERSESLKRGYRDNIACVLMDNLPGLKRGQKAMDKRNDVAEKIIAKIFG